jgi:tetratricopeptide (TPR) repeat protein
MTQFDQKGQMVWGNQQNAGHDIINTYPEAPWIPPMMSSLLRALSFVGREEDLAWLLEQLQDDAGKTLALCGPGGVGKTALAAEALARLTTQPDWLTRFPGGIFSYSFYPNPSLAVAFEQLARTLREDPGADPRHAAIRALSRRRTLLVFDGVEVLADTLPLRELGGRHVVFLLSRRLSDAPDLAYRRVLDLLSAEQGITLVQRLAGPRAADRSCVERLVEHIGGYPLALQLIGSYLSSRQEEVADYLQWFEEEGLLALHHGEHRSQSVRVLLQRTYESLTENEQNIFGLLGLLAPVSFPLELVQDILELPERAVREALGSLVNLSVLRRPDVGYEVSHLLIHAFAAERLFSPGNAASSPSIDTTVWREQFLTSLVTHFEQSDPYDAVALALWLPHVLSLLTTEPLTTQHGLRAADLFNAAGSNAFTQGKYGLAEPFYRRALWIYEQTVGEEHLSTASSLNNLAALYTNQGKYTEAEPLFQRALLIRERELGTNHPFTASSLNNLALLYASQGKYTQAEPLYRGALSIYEQTVGAEHPSMAQSMNNLATLYVNQGKYGLAEPFYRRALWIYEQTVGEEHLSTASSLNNLATLYANQGKYTEAEPLVKRALLIRERELGANHPSTASNLNNLATLYANQGKYTEAEPLVKRALWIYEQTVGEEHPDTATALNSLALLYKAQGKYDQAEPLYQRALLIRERELGAEHPDTAQSLSNLARLYADQGKDIEAEPLLKRVLVIRQMNLGADHPDTAGSLNNLAGFYADQGKYGLAEPLYQRALWIYEQVLGGEHPNTANCLNNLAGLYANQGKYTEAEPLYQRALWIYEQTVGGEHPDTASCLNNLASLYHSQGKDLRAEPLVRWALATCEQALGQEHPTTQTIRRNYVYLLQIMGYEKKRTGWKRILDFFGL